MSDVSDDSDKLALNDLDAESNDGDDEGGEEENEVDPFMDETAFGEDQEGTAAVMPQTHSYLLHGNVFYRFREQASFVLIL